MNGLRAAIVAAALAAVAVQPAQALSPDEKREIETFVAGNTVFTLFHEIGHALIDLLDLQLLGKEEDAVDNLATILMLGDGDSTENDPLIFAAADGWALMHAQAQETGEPMPFWSTHSLDIQRFHNIICLISGADPEGFEEIVSQAELPDERRDYCPEEYEKAADSWFSVLEPHKKVFGRGAKGRIKVVFDLPQTQANGKARDFVKKRRMGRTVAEMIGRQIALPQDLTLRFAPCEEPNAHYDPDSFEIVMC